ncbi:MAG: hypothetical protein OER04_08905 [Cyclobacteriaceae bacterium]|nr:hypothetical protein [Cyclobacteriaceae bacterium]
MNIESLDKALLEIVQKRNELKDIDYEDLKYDSVEEELHQMEDDFVENYGEDLEKVLQKIHDELCPETDVLLPIAYVAQKYIPTGTKEDGTEGYDVTMQEGVPVILEEYPDHPSRIVLVPNPPRLILQVAVDQRFQVWPESDVKSEPEQ